VGAEAGSMECAAVSIEYLNHISPPFRLTKSEYQGHDWERVLAEQIGDWSSVEIRS